MHLSKGRREPVVAAVMWAAVGIASSFNAAAQGPPPANRAPVADAGGPYAAVVGQPLLLSALKSVDPDGDRVTFAWSFSDGTSATGVTPTHLYAAPGTYPVTLLASDRKGGFASTNTTVVVMPRAEGNRAPLGVHNGPYVSVVNQPITIDASGSSNPDGDALSYAWTFGDGKSDTGPTVTHVYAKPGSYVIRLLATDNKGGASSKTTAAVITPAPGQSRNRPPAAFTTLSKATPYSGMPVRVDARASSDPDGDALSFTWVFDDDEVEKSAWAAHVFRTAGTHKMSLIVTDGRGGSDVSNFDVEVARTEGNRAPVPAIGGPYKGIAGAAVPFDARASTDPDGDDLTFIWEFGDGTKDSGGTAKHVFKTAGTFVVTALVSDDNGDTSVATTTVVIAAPNAASNAGSGSGPGANAGGPYTGTPGTAVMFSGGASSTATASGLVYAWTFGDGSNGPGRAVSHRYAAAGSYEAMLLVTDARGGESVSVAKVTIQP